MLRMHHPEQSCSTLALSIVVELVHKTARSQLHPTDIEEHVLDALRKEPGYEFEFARVTDFAFARTYRLLNDNGYQRGSFIEERKV